MCGVSGVCGLLFVVCCFLCAGRSLFVFRFSLFAVCCCLFVRCSLFVGCCLLYGFVLRSSFAVVWRLVVWWLGVWFVCLFVVRWCLYVGGCLFFVVCRSLFLCVLFVVVCCIVCLFVVLGVR